LGRSKSRRGYGVRCQAQVRLTARSRVTKGDNMTNDNSTLRHDQMEPGDHAWATMRGKLVVVMRVSNGFSDYEVCGPWECGCNEEGVNLIKRLEIPKGHEQTQLYYQP